MTMTLEELREEALQAREDIQEAAAWQQRNVKIYLHWTAGDYDTTYPEYHLCITGDGTIYRMMPLTDMASATWRRNRGSVAVTLCCAAGADENSLGNYPPTSAQIETMAQVIAILAGAFQIPIDKDHVLTHGEAADNEDGLATHPAYAWWHDECGDGDTRGDLEYLGTAESPVYNPTATDGSRGGDVLRGKAIWYKEEA